MAFPRPEGHHSITPGASVHNADQVLEFIQNVLGGKLVERYDGPDGSVAHAEVMIGDSIFMFGTVEPGATPYPAMLSYYVDEADQVDEVYNKALAAGATSKMEPANQFYGWRTATVTDTGGNAWTICCVVEQLSEEEINERMANMSGEA